MNRTCCISTHALLGTIAMFAIFTSAAVGWIRTNMWEWLLFFGAHRCEYVPFAALRVVCACVCACVLGQCVILLLAEAQELPFGSSHVASPCYVTMLFSHYWPFSLPLPLLIPLIPLFWFCICMCKLLQLSGTNQSVFRLFSHFHFRLPLFPSVLSFREVQPCSLHPPPLTHLCGIPSRGTAGVTVEENKIYFYEHSVYTSHFSDNSVYASES